MSAVTGDLFAPDQHPAAAQVVSGQAVEEGVEVGQVSHPGLFGSGRRLKVNEPDQKNRGGHAGDQAADIGYRMNALTHHVFGYGSLLWNPGFPYRSVRKVWVPGWTRRMWQGSTDHRGTPEFPGLVCTLVPDTTGGCWGLAYAVEDHHWAEVRAQLDFREKDGYQLVTLCGRDEAGEVTCWSYVADAANPSYIGDDPPARLAWRIRAARGESGDNADYLLRLHRRLRELEIDDPHVAELVSLLPQ